MFTHPTLSSIRQRAWTTYRSAQHCGPAFASLAAELLTLSVLLQESAEEGQYFGDAHDAQRHGPEINLKGCVELLDDVQTALLASAGREEVDLGGIKELEGRVRGEVEVVRGYRDRVMKWVNPSQFHRVKLMWGMKDGT